MSETEKILEVRGLTYAYKKKAALRDVNFTVKASSIHGFIGPNGAGKTTTLMILSTLLKPQGGGIRVFGHEIVRGYRAVRQKIGFMPDHLSMYHQMTVFEYLDFFGAAYGMKSAYRAKAIADILALTDMDGRRNDYIQSLSRGMQQRVSLARVLIHDPDLLLLDEPASGLDPRARIELMEVLKELSNMGKTIFISSHILTELADLCDSVTIIDRGTTKYSGSLAELPHRREGGVRFTVGLDSPQPEIDNALGETEGVKECSLDEQGLTISVEVDPEELSSNALLQKIIALGGEVISFREDMRHLNQAFLDLTTPGVGR